MSLAFIIVAIILFVLEGIRVPSGRVSLGWFGLAFWAGSTVVGNL